MIFTCIAVALAIGRVSAQSSNVVWGDCPPEASDLNPEVKCSQLKVPLDWSNPGGDTITLGMVKLPSTNSSAKTLLINPGGPGLAAVPEVIVPGGTGLFWFTPELRDAFDIVAVDPRGVYTSNPVSCNMDLFNQRVSYFPQNEKDYNAMVEHWRQVGESCLNQTGPLLGHIDSISVAHDVEAVRLALGGDKLNFVGLSYASVSMSVYAEMYGENIRALVLDANMDHNQAEVYTWLEEVRTYEMSLTRFFDWCDQNETCAIHGMGSSSGDLFDELIANASKTPIPAPGCVESKACREDVNGEEILFRTQGYLLFRHSPPQNIIQQNWTILGEVLAEAVAGNATMLSTELVVEPNDQTLPMFAIPCLDWPANSRSVADLLYKQNLAAAIAPHTKGASEFWQIQTSCIDWPVPIQYPVGPINVTKAPPVLFVGAYFDPAVSYDGSVGLQEQFQGSVLLTRDGDGHTSYGLQGETGKAINEYLLTLKLPEPNTIYMT